MHNKNAIKYDNSHIKQSKRASAQKACLLFDSLKKMIGKLFLRLFDLLFGQIFFFDCDKAFGTDDVLDLAGILVCDLWLDADSDQPIGKNRVSLINRFCNGKPFRHQCDVAVGIDLDHFALSKIFHSHAHARLGEI